MKFINTTVRIVFILSIIFMQYNESSAQELTKKGSVSGSPDFRFQALSSIKLFQNEDSRTKDSRDQSGNTESPLPGDQLYPAQNLADIIDTFGIHSITNPTLIVSEGGGYVSGNNAFGDLAKAIFRSPASGHAYITGVALWFGYATGNSSSTVAVGIWDDSGGPFNLLAYQTITLGEIMTDIFFKEMTYVNFLTPVPNPGLYYAGIILPDTEGDTVAVYSSGMDDFAEGNAWEMWSDFMWTPVDLSWDLELRFGIFPIELTPTSVQDLRSSEPSLSYELYPNPTHGRFTLEFTDRAYNNLRIQVYDITGKQVYDELLDNPKLHRRIEIFPGGLSKGVYLVRLSSENKTGVQRLIVH